MDGQFTIVTGEDAIKAETDLLITTATMDIVTAGGSSYSYSSSTSAKGLKSGVATVIEGGTYELNTYDDAIHSNGRIQIDNGTYSIASGDDGIHANTSITINAGTFDITKSYEGIESATLNLNGGNVYIESSDDGLNAAGGNDASSMGRPGQGSFSSSGNYYIYINGGYYVIDADGDGIDANGSITMTDGTVLVNGPTSSGNGALDYDGTFKLNGGFLIAAGISGMAEAPSSSSSQYCIKATLQYTQSADNIFHIETSDGTSIVTFSPCKSYSSVVFSSPELAQGETYSIYLDGSSSGTSTDGLYSDGNYTKGSLFKSFTISQIITTVSSSSY